MSGPETWRQPAGAQNWRSFPLGACARTGDTSARPAAAFDGRGELGSDPVEALGDLWVGGFGEASEGGAFVRVDFRAGLARLSPRDDRAPLGLIHPRVDRDAARFAIDDGVHRRQFLLRRTALDVLDGTAVDERRVTSRAGLVRLERYEPGGASPVLFDDACQPSLSPRGDRVALARLVKETFQLAVAPLDRPEALEQLTRGGSHVAFPGWSPDGAKIAFLTRPVRDLTQFTKFHGEVARWVVDLEGHAAKLTEQAPLELSRPVWGPDGLWVLARDSGGPSARLSLLQVTPR